MIKEIKYNGYTSSPSDYSSPDGEMSLLLNAIPEDGGLRPLPSTEFKTIYARAFFNDYRVYDVYIHKTQSQDNQILYAGDRNGKGLFWAVDSNNVGVDNHLLPEAFRGTFTPKHIYSIGNCLLLLDTDGLPHYLMWDGTTYNYLGTNIPDLSLEPYIETDLLGLGDLRQQYDEMAEIPTEVPIPATYRPVAVVYESGGTYEIPHAEKQGIYEAVFGSLNKIQKTLRSTGKFLSPFYVRLAYRLYDGTHTMHTVPVLMLPTTSCTPFMGVRVDKDGEGKVYWTPVISSSSLRLKGELKNLYTWRNLITHIDVFVTPPLINYTDSPETFDSISAAPYANRTGAGEWSKDYARDTLISNNGNLQSLIRTYDNGHENADLVWYRTQFKVVGGKRFKPGKPGDEVYLVVDTTKGGTTELVYFDNLLRHEIFPQRGDYPSWLPLPSSGTYQVYKIEEPALDHRFKGVTGTAYCRVYVRSNATYGLRDTFLQINTSRTDGKTFDEVLVDYSTFYKCAEISLVDLITSDSETLDIPVIINKSILDNITAQPLLKEEGNQRRQNIISTAFAYNNRLNICVDSEMPPSCIGINQQSNTYNVVANAETGDEVNHTIVSATVKIEENGQVIYKDVTGAIKPQVYPLYFCYPSLTATELIIRTRYNIVAEDGSLEPDDNSTPKEYYRTESILLRRHSALNLSYAYNSLNQLRGEPSEDEPQHTQTAITYGNKIKTSEVNNPFLFPESSVSELPVNTLYGLSTAAQALSTGQFGQYPLYAFADEGIWALEVGSDGHFSSRQVISRDVVLTPDSITQLDNAVLFITERGLMLLAGSQVQCISDDINGEHFDIKTLKTLADGLSNNIISGYKQSMKEYIKQALLFYDYPTQQIILYNPETAGLSYVYSLRSKKWGMSTKTFNKAIAGFPRGYLLTGTRDAPDALEYFDENSTAATPATYLTRPLKLDNPDVYKTITAVILRGNIDSSEVYETLLYGSNDLKTWHPVYGSTGPRLRGLRGSPYKYFRIAGHLRLNLGDSLQSVTIEYENRMTNRLR